MNKEFYSIGRGSLNINGKFYYGLDYQITDFMRNLEQENEQLKQQLQQRDNIINKAREKIKKSEYAIDFETNGFSLTDYDINEILEILNIDKGDD